MKKHKGITLVETLVVIGIILFGVFVWAVISVRPMALRLVCGVNLKGLGTAMRVYAHDYDGRYPQLPGTGQWSKELGFTYDTLKPDFSPGGEQGNTPRTVTASWYLLVRECDVSPKSLICPHSKQEEFNGKNPNNLDLFELWDFGPTSHKHVSYALHNPYGRFPATVYAKKEGFSSFAIAADMNPWFKNGDILPPGTKNATPQIITLKERVAWFPGNSTNHRSAIVKRPHGQNVLFSDGHISYEQQPNVGVGNDNIYTFWSTDENPTQQDIQGGTAPTGRTPENDAKSETDSFLVI